MLLRSPLLVAHLCSFSRVVVSAGLTDISGLEVKAFDRLNRSKIDHLTLKRWPPQWLWKRQSPTGVLLRNPVTQMITFNQGIYIVAAYKL